MMEEKGEPRLRERYNSQEEYVQDQAVDYLWSNREIEYLLRVASGEEGIGSKCEVKEKERKRKLRAKKLLIKRLHRKIEHQLSEHVNLVVNRLRKSWVGLNALKVISHHLGICIADFIENNFYN